MRRIFILGLLYALVACSAKPLQTVPAPSTVPPPSATAAATPSATVPATDSPTSKPSPTPISTPPESNGGQVVSFTTNDGVTLGGTLYGRGTRAVILSNIGSGTQSDWQVLPALLAQRGYLVLTYDWRGYGASGGSRDYVASVQDLAAAIGFIRAQGASRIILAGGSLGGIASIKNAQIPELAGLVVISSPRNAPQLGIADRDISAITVPKLFVGSTNDSTVPYSETTAMFGAAVEPKTLQTFSGSAHGTDLFKTSDHDALVRLLLNFVQESLPRPSQAQSEFTSSYVIPPDRFISIFVDGGALMYRDFKTGRLGALTTVGEDTFGIGPGMTVQSPIESILIFTRNPGGHVSGLTWKPSGASNQEPVAVGKRVEGFFTEQQVRFQNGEVSLAGALLVPSKPGPHPALVFISGSNPAKRTDIYPRIRAEFLLYYGFAVLLYDKRGVGDSTGVYREYASDRNIDDLAGDGLAAVEFLKTRAEIDPRRIGLYGSSQAGWITPRIATRTSDVAFMLLLSGPTVSPAQQDLYRSLLGQPSLTEADITSQVLAAGPTDFDPVPYLVKTTIPSLWIFGGRDELIPAQACITILEQLQRAGHRNHTIRLFPTANHALYDTQATPTPGVVTGVDDAIIGWLLQQAK